MNLINKIVLTVSLSILLQACFPKKVKLELSSLIALASVDSSSSSTTDTSLETTTDITTDTSQEITTDTTTNTSSDTSTKTDTTAPVPGNSGTIASSSILSSSLTLSWTKAIDDTTTQANLFYKVIYSAANNIATVSDANNNGTVAQTYVTDINIYAVSSLSAATAYYFTVIVRDEAGNEAIYTTTTITTPAVTVVGAPWGTTNQTPGSGNGLFDNPYSLVLDSSDSVYVLDRYNERVQVLTSNGSYSNKWGQYGTGNVQFIEPYGNFCWPEWL
ncbi:MAG: hypothetical protein AAF518_26275 [Spirochaetota bacterium]